MERNWGIWADKILAERRQALGLTQHRRASADWEHIIWTQRYELIYCRRELVRLLAAGSLRGKSSELRDLAPGQEGHGSLGQSMCTTKLFERMQQQARDRVSHNPLADFHLVSQLRVSLIPPKIVPHLACPADHLMKEPLSSSRNHHIDNYKYYASKCRSWHV